MSSFARLFESIGHEHGCYLVRCDISFLIGMGSSQLIGPIVTETAPSYNEETMHRPLQSHDRSDPMDNNWGGHIDGPTTKAAIRMCTSGIFGCRIDKRIRGWSKYRSFCGVDAY